MNIKACEYSNARWNVRIFESFEYFIECDQSITTILVITVMNSINVTRNGEDTQGNRKEEPKIEGRSEGIRQGIPK